MSTLFSTPGERHIFLIGFFEVLCPWKPRTPKPKRHPMPFATEYHYYVAGRGAGFLALVLILSGIITLLKEVLT